MGNYSYTLFATALSHIIEQPGITGNSSALDGSSPQGTPNSVHCSATKAKSSVWFRFAPSGGPALPAIVI